MHRLQVTKSMAHYSFILIALKFMITSLQSVWHQAPKGRYRSYIDLGPTAFGVDLELPQMRCDAWSDPS